MKIAIIHDWLVKYAGSERVLEKIIELYPTADLYSLIDFIPPQSRDFIQNKSVKTTYLQKIPGSKKFYTKLLPLMPSAIERLNLTGYDLIISSSHAVAKGVITTRDQIHITYLQARNLKYAYEDRFFYESGSFLRLLQDIFLSKVRVWDSVASQRPDFTAANSQYVSEWHFHRHKVKSKVIYPPVDIELFSKYYSDYKEDYFIVISRLEPYKKIDIIIKAFNSLKQPLKIIGDGSIKNELKSMASDHIEFLGYQDSETIAHYVGRAKAFVFSGREDFGISLVEAQAAGTPVIAFAQGGAKEIVINLGGDSPTGILFKEQTAECLIDAVNTFESAHSKILSLNCRDNAARFSIERFKEEFHSYVQLCIKQSGDHV